jgi:hypothetical protein
MSDLRERIRLASLLLMESLNEYSPQRDWLAALPMPPPLFSTSASSSSSSSSSSPSALSHATTKTTASGAAEEDDGADFDFGTLAWSERVDNVAHLNESSLRHLLQPFISAAPPSSSSSSSGGGGGGHVSSERVERLVLAVQALQSRVRYAMFREGTLSGMTHPLPCPLPSHTSHTHIPPPPLSHADHHSTATTASCMHLTQSLVLF